VIDHLILRRTDRGGFGEEAPFDLSKARAYGTERVVCCPYHPDQTPSLWVNTEKLCFHCFACEASGLVIAKGSDFAYKLPLPSFRPTQPSNEHLEQLNERHRLLSDVLGYYQLQMLYAEPYLKRRGISLETASQWGCGVCDYQPIQPFLDFMQQRGWASLEPLFLNSVLRKSPTGIIVASLRGRVVFPLTHEGRISNLAGRHLLSKGVSKTEDLKWLFLKNLKPQPKGIFAEKNLKSERVILTESIFDTLPWLQSDRPAIALMGTALPDWMLLKLKGKEVYFALNGDEAGEIATRKQIARLQGVAKEIRLIHLPAGHNDWNEYHCQRNLALGLGEAS
jgi:DNA primase